MFILFFAGFSLFLQPNINQHTRDTLHPTAPPTAMAQEHVCLCASLLQQSFAGEGLLYTDAYRIHVVLSDFKFHLLLQRPA